MWRRVVSVSLSRFLLDYTRITLREAYGQPKAKDGPQPELVVWLCRLRKCEMLSAEAVEGLWASNHLRANRSMCGLLLKDIFGLDAQQYELVQRDLDNAIAGHSGMYQSKLAPHKFALVLKLPDDIAHNKKVIGAGTAVLAALASGAVLFKKEPSGKPVDGLEKLSTDLDALLLEKDALCEQVRQLQDRYESGYRHEEVCGAVGDMNRLGGEIILNTAVRPKVRIKLKDCTLVPNLVLVINRGESIGDVLWTHIYSNPVLMRTVTSIRIVSSDGEALASETLDEDILFAKTFLYIRADIEIEALFINTQHAQRVQEISRSVHLCTFTIRTLHVYSEHYLNVEWFVKRSHEVHTLLKGSIDTVPEYIIAKGNTTVVYGSDFTMDRLRADVQKHPDIVDKLRFLRVPHSMAHEQLISTEFPTLCTKIKFYPVP